MRTRSQPMSPSGYLALDNDRPTRTRSKKKATPESSIERSIEPPTEPSSSSHRVTRSQGKKPDGIEQEPSAESEISDSAEATRPKSTPASPQKKVASKKTSRRTGKAKASASDPTPQQNVESVVINQNATTENEGQETRRSPRKGKAKSKATSQHPVNPPVSRVTRSQSRQPDSMEDNATTNGEEPKHSRRPRRTRAASRTTPQPLDGTPTLRPDHADQTAVSEDEPLATTDRNGPNAVNKEITGFEEAQAEGKENLSPKLTRKRRRDDDPEPTTPKRRNLGPPAAFSERPRRQVPFLTRGPFRPLPLAERERRRRAERSGRLHSTLFHLPEYVSQAGAEHKEQETRPVPLQHSEPATHPDEPRTEPESTPVTPQRGWSIRGLLNSMPRPFSRFIPSLGSLASRPNSLDAPEGGAVPASEISEASEPPAATTPHEVLEPPAAEAPEVSAPARQSSETGTVHQPDDPSFPEGDSLLSEADLRYRKRLEEFEKNVKREMIGDYELTYSLFPRPWDTRRWLESSKHTSKTASPKVPSKTTPKSLSKASPKPTANATPKSTSKVAQNHSTNIAPKTALQTTPQPQKAKKRKRAPSPDVIPNPPGCSYGMDLEYFYIDESEEDEEIVTPSHEAPKGTSAAPKSAIRSADQSIQPPSKKVRFDASPQDSPSKIRSRARATEPYTGRHFIGMGEGPAQTDRMDAHPPAVASAATSHQTAAQPSHTPTSAGTAPFPGPHTALGPPNGLGLPTTPGFPTAPGLPAASGLPATPGVLATPDLSTGPAPIPVSTPTQATTTTTQAITPPTQAVTTPAQAITTPTQVTATPTQATTTPIQAPTTPTQATTTSANDQDLSARVTALPAGPSQLEAPPITDKPEDEVVAKARSQVEKFKPKTPSALRTTSRYSSPLTTSPDLFSNLRPSLDFGDDQAGRDAQWLYEICPSGKMEELKWPTKQKVTDSLDIDNRSRQLLVKTWNNLEVDDNHSLFCNMMEESE